MAIPVHSLYTNVGRGHPFYLDGLNACLPTESRGTTRDVFDITRGPTRAAWQLVRTLYTRGSSLGGQNSLYARLRRRTDYNHRGLMMRVLGHELPDAFAGIDGTLVVAHPLLAAIMRDHPSLVYQHGEVVVPPECLVIGHHHVLVPTQRVADVFLRAGHAEDRVHVTGLCIDPRLAQQASDAYDERRGRLAKPDTPLTIAMFSSGAEPVAHVELLMSAARSCSTAGMSVHVIAKEEGRLHKDLLKSKVHARERVTVHTYTTRDSLDALTAEHFRSWDVFVAPAHERTNWALGLGLPMLVLDPAIGSFAPRNRLMLLGKGVALPVASQMHAINLPGRLYELRSLGELAAMAQRGWGQFPITGFEQAAALTSSL